MKLLRRLCLYLVAILLPFLAIEIMMIVLEEHWFQGFYQYDEQMGFRVRPGAAGSNEFGFNDRDYPHTKASGTFRILFVGDSIGWAGDKDGNYTALLEGLFEQHYGAHRVDVINAGYSMTHTAEQLQMLERFGLEYQPDLVVLGVAAGNDFYDAVPNRKRIVVNGLYLDVDSRNEWVVFGYPIIPRSRLLLFVSQQLMVRSERNRALRDAIQRGLPVSNPVLSEESFLRVMGARLQFCHKRAIREQIYAENVDTIFRSIEAMKATLDARGIGLVLAIIPGELQVDPVLQQKVFEHFDLRRRDYDLECAQKLLRKFARRSGIPTIDLLPGFQEARKTGRLYVYLDGHWNERGRSLAAELLFEQLDPRVEFD